MRTQLTLPEIQEKLQELESKRMELFRSVKDHVPGNDFFKVKRAETALADMSREIASYKKQELLLRKASEKSQFMDDKKKFMEQ